MIHCNGCGFYAERSDVKSVICRPNDHDQEECSACVKCAANPDLRESYRRGFNAGLNAASSYISDSCKAIQRLRRVENG